MDKNKQKKRLFLGIGICSLALGGTVYGAYNLFTAKDNEVISTQSEPLNPIERKQSDPVLPKSSEGKKASESVTKSFKSSTEDSDFSNFRTNPVTSYENERIAAVNLLNNLIQDEKKPTSQQPVQETIKNPIESVTPPMAEQQPAPVVPPVTPPEPEEETPIIPEIPVIVDYSILLDLVLKGQHIDQSLYISSSVEALNIELVIGQRLIEDQNSSQAAVNNQVERLQSALNHLVLKGDKTSLQNLFNQANQLQLDIYTNESVQVFDDALKESREILDLTDVAQTMIDKTLEKLEEAIKQLTEKEEPYLSLAYLQRVVAEAEAIDQGVFLTEGIENLQLVLSDVLDFISAEEYTKEEIEEKQEALRQAIDQLIRKADKTSLIRLLEDAQALDLSIYTEESSNHLESVIAEVSAAVENAELSQSENDLLLEQLQAAIDQLVENEMASKPDEMS